MYYRRPLGYPLDIQLDYLNLIREPANAPLVCNWVIGVFPLPLELIRKWGYIICEGVRIHRFRIFGVKLKIRAIWGYP